MKQQTETYTGYMVEMQVGRYWLVAWQTSKGTPLIYRDEDEAVQMVNDHLKEWRDAVVDGFVDEAPKPSQFRVVEVEYQRPKFVYRRRK